jgi:hypothetical protein
VATRFSDYSPKTQGAACVTESCEAFVTRIQGIFPHLPHELLTQWFWDHPQSVENYLWLDFGSLRISKRLLGTTDVIEANVCGGASVAEYRDDYYRRAVGSQKSQSLHNHFSSHGTWPVPPIFLSNQSGDLVGSDGTLCGRPLHLVEGGNRMAHFMEFQARGKCRDYHEVFVIEANPWVQSVRQTAVLFRKHFVDMPKDLKPFWMANFPRGGCGFMTTLLGNFLSLKGLGMFTYVCRERGEECSQANDWTSHAWLEKDGLIVDVTADQFDDCKDEVIVTSDSDFHRSFVMTTDSPEPLHIIGPGSRPDLVATYEYIIRVIEEKMGQISV